MALSPGQPEHLGFAWEISADLGNSRDIDEVTLHILFLIDD
jgi:hypothetical protein